MTRAFKLYRDKDLNGVSGTGLICEGALFSDGHAVIHWLGQYPLTTPHPDGLSSIFAIHDHGGKGDLRLVWEDDLGDEKGFSERDIEFLHEVMGKASYAMRGNLLLNKIRRVMAGQSRKESTNRG
jgi:hypothetical protein